mmetsp:Transcript_9300/g.29667  ORF Transcript_9300/g.29667 Transcript_9300/m.29667 type:complete len:200 (-) Transcript_9300:352-951(-)
MGHSERWWISILARITRASQRRHMTRRCRHSVFTWRSTSLAITTPTAHLSGHGIGRLGQSLSWCSACSSNHISWMPQPYLHSTMRFGQACCSWYSACSSSISARISARDLVREKNDRGSARSLAPQPQLHITMGLASPCTTVAAPKLPYRRSESLRTTSTKKLARAQSIAVRPVLSQCSSSAPCSSSSRQLSHLPAAAA